MWTRRLARMSAIALMLIFDAVVHSVQAESGSVTGDGVCVHQLPSPYQAGSTTLRVLLPDDLKDNQYCRVLFILPVHKDGDFRHGNGLAEVRRRNVHNTHQLICVAPSFSSTPWYADHDRNPAKRDESHLLRTVMPFVETHYPVRTDVQGRLLIGFSKSGWGAMTLLLRHPDRFHRAVAWDPGIRIDTGPFGKDFDREQRMQTNFGSRENFEAHRVSTLIRTRGKDLGDDVRLFYFNCAGNHRTAGGTQLHELMTRTGLPHHYVMDRPRQHRWDSGWLPEAITFLVNESRGAR